jgi:hypothetical protein
MSPWLWPLLLAGTADAPPTLCLQTSGEAAIDQRELLAAIRARIDRRDVRVETCSDVEVAFRVRAQWLGREWVELQLEGPDVKAERRLFVEGLGRQEISQTIALTIGDAVRRPLDALLVRLGLPVPKPAEPTCPDVPAPPPCPRCAEVPPPGPPPPPCPTCEACEACAECPPPIEVQPSLHLELALWPGLTAGDAGLAFFGGLEANLQFGPLTLAPHLGVSRRLSEQVIDLSSFELGLSGRVEVGPLAFGLGLAERAQRVSVSGTANADGVTTTWSAGLFATADLTLLAWGPAELGLGIRAWFWPNPARFRIDGVIQREEPFFEVGVFPRLSFRPF